MKSYRTLFPLAAVIVAALVLPAEQNCQGRAGPVFSFIIPDTASKILDPLPAARFSKAASAFYDDNPFETSPWPAYSAMHATPKIATSVNCMGIVDGFEFPVGSRIQYLNRASLWVGGIVGRDTVVTTGHAEDLDTVAVYPYRDYCMEFYPPNVPTDFKSHNPLNCSPFEGYSARFVDTFTHEQLQQANHTYQWAKNHVPLNLSVRQHSYTCDMSPYRNIVILDYIITNLGQTAIENAYVGLSADGDCVNHVNEAPSDYSDDLIGSFRDIHTIYMIDNDGNPSLGRFDEGVSVPDAMGIRLIGVYPPVTDTNFNWWCWGWNGWYNFGPRTKPTPDDPYFDFGIWGDGAPNGDLARYYLLSHPEWDYDQIRTASILPDDDLWMYPGNDGHYISCGSDVAGVLSLGPIDLAPGASVRALFGIFGGEMVHVDPDNWPNLHNLDIDEFYDNLFFDIFLENADLAVAMAEDILDPLAPPAPPDAIIVSNDSVWLQWDPWVFPEVTGYELYISPVPDSLLIGPGKAAPVLSFDHVGVNPLTFEADSTATTLTGLEPGRLYYASLMHLVGTSKGDFSRPAIAGKPNRAFVQQAIRLDQEFLYFYGDDFKPPLRWRASDDNRVAYYRIYRTHDSSLAFNRYHPFLHNDSSEVPYPASRCLDVGDSTYCYYAMTVYDSVSPDVTEYTDQNPFNGAYYWVSAIIQPGFESPFSDIIRAEKIPRPSRDMVVILGSTGSIHDYVIVDSLRAYYERLLDGYDYDIYNWTDTNLMAENCPSGYCTDWLDLAQYRLVLVEEFPSPRILARNVEPSHKLLTRLVDSHHELVFFGTPPGDGEFYLHTLGNDIRYDTGRFENAYFNLDSATLRSWPESYGVADAIDSLAGFNAAIPTSEDLPTIHYDTHNNRFKPFFKGLFQTADCFPLTAALFPGNQTEVLYTYSSRYPQTSQLQGRPCGFLSTRGSSNIHVFSFHLWGMEEDEARDLIDYLMADVVTDTATEEPLRLPKRYTLHQNYPNPFNSRTIITYDLPAATEVTLTVYNILGQEVRRLVSDRRLAGAHSVAWDGADQGGQPVASGIYL